LDVSELKDPSAAREMLLLLLVALNDLVSVEYLYATAFASAMNRSRCSFVHCRPLTKLCGVSVIA
jgi:hypothetical protein